MTEETPKKHITGNCFDCGGTVELFEMNMDKSTKVMFCKNCELYHFYKKDFLGTYKLIKVSKNPSPP